MVIILTKLVYILKLLSDKTIVGKMLKPKAMKKAKDRLIILFRTNMLSKNWNHWLLVRLRIIVVWNTKKWTCLIYVTNANSWMTKYIFINYLSKLNSKFVSKNRKVIVFLINFSGHKIEDCSNIKLCFIPANATSSIQLMDQGVINLFKVWIV